MRLVLVTFFFVDHWNFLFEIAHNLKGESRWLKFVKLFEGCFLKREWDEERSFLNYTTIHIIVERKESWKNRRILSAFKMETNKKRIK